PHPCENRVKPSLALVELELCHVTEKESGWVDVRQAVTRTEVRLIQRRPRVPRTRFFHSWRLLWPPRCN
ncbi:hypothetical protein B296_00054778, partial [Ensete ventricosum]